MFDGKAQKCTSAEWKEQIRTAETPEQAREIGQTHVDRDDINSEYEEQIAQLLKDAYKAKFMQHPDLQERLLQTQHHIVYASPGMQTNCQCSTMVIVADGGRNRQIQFSVRMDRMCLAKQSSRYAMTCVC
jgi:hypothetical protein